MNKVTAGMLMFAAARFGALAHDGPGIGIEDPAPPFTVSRWFKGTPVERFESGTVYVIAFWSTWSAPGTDSFPLLTELSHRFAGKVRIIGVSVFERERQEEARIQNLTEFIARQGTNLDFSVAADTADGALGRNWLWAANETSLPVVFVIDRDGCIAWLGQPEKGLAVVLAKVVDGTFDRKAAHEELHAARAAVKREQDVLRGISELWQQKKFTEALAAIDRLVADKPAYRAGLIPLRFNLLLQADEPAAYRYAKELATSEFKEQANSLDGLARAICDTPGLKDPDYALAMALSRQACALDRSPRPRHLATLAEVCFRAKDFDQAIRTAEQAMEVAKKLGAVPEALNCLDTLPPRLKRFREAKAAEQSAK